MYVRVRDGLSCLGASRAPPHPSSTRSPPRCRRYASPQTPPMPARVSKVMANGVTQARVPVRSCVGGGPNTLPGAIADLEPVYVALPEPGDASRDEARQTVRTLEPPPHHVALRRVLVRLRERHRGHDASVFAIEPGPTLAVVNGAEVGAPLAPTLYFGKLRSMSSRATSSSFSRTTTGACLFWKTSSIGSFCWRWPFSLSV